MSADATKHKSPPAGTEHQQALCLRTREEHDELLAAMHQLEAALACAAAGREGAWNELVRQRLQAVADSIAAHVRSAEGRDGLFAQVESVDPNLEFRTARRRREHAQLLQHAEALKQLIESGGGHGGQNFQDVRKLSMRLLNALRNHQAAEADLVFEAFFTDLGVGD